MEPLYFPHICSGNPAFLEVISLLSSTLSQLFFGPYSRSMNLAPHALLSHLLINSFSKVNEGTELPQEVEEFLEKVLNVSMHFLKNQVQIPDVCRTSKNQLLTLF